MSDGLADVDLTVYATQVRQDALELEAMIQEHDDETRALVQKLRDLAEKLDSTNALIDAFCTTYEVGQVAMRCARCGRRVPSGEEHWANDGPSNVVGVCSGCAQPRKSVTF